MTKEQFITEYCRRADLSISFFHQHMRAVYSVDLGWHAVDKPEEPMTHTINLVREFHQAFNHPVANSPTPATEDLRVLRVRLIAEELAELCQALRVDLYLTVCCHDNGEHYEYVEAVDASAAGEPDLIEAADACGDLDYVVQGANLVFGFPAEAITREIHRSNMSKLGADGKPIYREDGKVLKGPNYSPPDIAPILERGTGGFGSTGTGALPDICSKI